MGLGKVCTAQMRVAINQDLKGLILSPRVLAEYLTLYLRSCAAEFERLGSGATVKGIKLEELRAWPVPLPFQHDVDRSLEVQRRIVARIESLLTEVNMARTHLIQMRHDAAKLIYAALQEVFPRSEKDLPQGWQLRTIEDIKPSDRPPVQTGPFGAQLKSDEFVGTGIPVVAIGNVQWGKLVLHHDGSDG